MRAASSNAVAAMLAMERALDVTLSPQTKLRIAAEVGSDLPLFLIGGTVLGVGRGEEVYPLPDVPATDVVVVTPPIGVSTPKAFAQWDALVAERQAGPGAESGEAALTASGVAGTINEFSASVFTWLSTSFPQAGQPASGVPALGGDRARRRFSTLSEPGSRMTSNASSFLSIPSCERLSVSCSAKARSTRRCLVQARRCMGCSPRLRKHKLLPRACSPPATQPLRPGR